MIKVIFLQNKICPIQKEILFGQVLACI